jgi:Transposase DDE domain
MYVTIVPNRDSPPAVLLRESYREDGKVKNRTLANLSKWPAAKIEALRAVLADEAVAAPSEGLSIERSWPHGHVAAALGTALKVGLDRVLSKGPKRKRDLALAMIVARLVDPAAKLATARALDEGTASHSLGRLLGLGTVEPNDLYETLDWLLAQQGKIEKVLARRHLKDGALVLYDVTSTYLEGRCCPLARLGYSRDHRRDRPQIVIGLMSSADGCPVAVEVFAGNVGDPATLKVQIDKLKRRFGLSRIVLVGDRGMITTARLDEEVRPAGLDWITALRAPAIRALAEAGGPLQLDLFDERDLAEIESPDYPGERLVVCRNGALAAERARKRQDLLFVTERELERIKARVRRARAPLRGQARIGQAVGAVIDRRKVGKHFTIAITDADFTFSRNQDAIDAEARLDGIYVLRTSVLGETLDAPGVVAAYKGLARAERAFRSLKSVDLEVRPVFHWTEDRVRAHVLLCVLAYHLEWHMRAALAPILFDDHDRIAAEAQRTSPVAKAKVSPAARRKAATKLTDDGLPVSSFRSLIDHLATLTCNDVRFGKGHTLSHLTSPTPLQQRAFELLKLKPAAQL